MLAENHASCWACEVQISVTCQPPSMGPAACAMNPALSLTWSRMYGARRSYSSWVIPSDGGVALPDTSGSLREVLLETDPQARLVRVILREAGNIETEFRFRNWEENIPILEAQFHFQPPPGVTIVDEATLAGVIH